MTCRQEPGKAGAEFFERFNTRAVQRRIPVLGGIELTGRCNLNCVHCYVSHHDRKGGSARRELSTRQWMDLIDQFTESGCLRLLFTGGEAMLRPDFCDIYRHARECGLLVTVFTNGTLIDDAVIETFAAYPPHSVEVSIYGKTAETYERVTGVRGSFEKCMAGIRRLKAHGFRLQLKTILLKENIQEFGGMEKLAADLEVSFRFDAMVFPRLDGDQAPVAHRVSPKEAVSREFADQKRAQDWSSIFIRKGKIPASTELYQCGAGLTLFHVDPSGGLRPCLMLSGGAHDLLEKRFSDIWHDPDFIDFRQNVKSPPPCRGCDMKSLCGYCPGFFKLEKGSEQVHSAYLCDIGRARYQAIQTFDKRQIRYGRIGKQQNG